MWNIERYGKIICSAVLACLLAGCSGRADVPVHIEEVHVTVQGMTQEVKLAYLSDLHIATLSDEVEESDAVNERIGWTTTDGITSADRWPMWVDTLNKTGADRVLFGADMLDFNSASNADVLKKDMARLEIPYTYIRADHDMEPFYLKDTDPDICYERQKQICGYEDVYVDEYPEFAIVGWNNSTSQLTVEGMEKIRQAAALDKPLILLTHVPIAPLDDDSLALTSRNMYGRDLIWSRGGTENVPDDTPDGQATAELLELIYADDTPFIEILCGHLHTTWDGYVTEHVHEHVFSAAYAGCMGIITVTGK